MFKYILICLLWGDITECNPNNLLTYVYCFAKISNLSSHNGSKINKLISKWRKGTVSTVRYFQSRGFSCKLLNKYKNNRWLDLLFSITGDCVSFFKIIIAFQHFVKMVASQGETY